MKNQEGTMTREQFINEARSFGHSDDEIKDLLNFHDKYSIPYEEMMLLERFVD